MGKVLEMKMHPVLHLAAIAVACAVLAGCGSPLVQAAMARAAGPVASPVASPAKDSPQIAMTLVSRSIKFPLQQLDADGDVRLWAAADGVQVALRDGLLISTRGFGMDLMSAEVPAVADLWADHTRTHHYLDGADTPIRRSYSCSVATAPGDEKVPGTTHVQETCRGDAGRITNDYWITSKNRLARSRQWVSQGVGYVIFDTAAQLP